MQIILLLQTYSYQAIIIIIIIIIITCNILFLWELHYLCTDSVNQKSADTETNVHIVAIFLIPNLRTIFHLSSYDVPISKTNLKCLAPIFH
jgi:hypothetical protein